METINAWVLAMAFALIAPATFADNPVNEIYNYYPLPQQLGTSGQPTPEQFARIKAEGFDVVINLAMPTSQDALADEGRLVSDAGMTYVHIPVPWEAPNSDHLEQFFGIMNAMLDQDKKVWVHCAANYRASAFAYKYLTQAKGVAPEQASTPLLKTWLPQMDPSWRAIYDLTTTAIQSQ